VREKRVSSMSPDEVRYLRRDLEIARELARLKRAQSERADAIVSDLEARLREFEPVTPNTLLKDA